LLRWEAAGKALIMADSFVRSSLPLHAGLIDIVGSLQDFHPRVTDRRT
jgi:hypothetical protein